MKKPGLSIIFGVMVFVVLFGFTAYAQQAAPAAPAAAATPAPAPAAAAALVTAPAAAAGDKVELKLELPKAAYEGTKKDVTSKHLDPATGKSRAVFMVPKEVVLLSKGKKVTASDNEPVIGDVSMVTDGDKEGVAGSSVEFGPGLQWEQVDLGATAEIYAVLVWHYHAEGRIYRDVIVQVSDDPTFVKEVKTLFNNDDDNSSKLGVGKDYEYVETNEGRLVDGRGIKGRYVRCSSNGNTTNDLNHMIEIEVYGRPAK